MRARFVLPILLLCSIAGARAGAQGPTPPAEVAPPAAHAAPRTPVPPAPRAAWTADPADSLYRLARAALADGDFRRAATLFATVAERYADSEYAPDALYY